MWTNLNKFVLSLVTRVQIGREEGQALVEYSLILALVSVVAILLLTTIGNDIKGVLEKVVEALKGA
jgi:pilus assembly protein Flp/PilA